MFHTLAYSWVGHIDVSNKDIEHDMVSAWGFCDSTAQTLEWVNWQNGQWKHSTEKKVFGRFWSTTAPSVCYRRPVQKHVFHCVQCTADHCLVCIATAWAKNGCCTSASTTGTHWQCIRNWNRFKQRFQIYIDAIGASEKEREHWRPSCYTSLANLPVTSASAIWWLNNKV